MSTTTRHLRMTEAVNQLIVDRKFTVAKRGKDLQLIKMVGKRPVTVYLKFVEDGWWIEPPKHEFICTYSHFDFADTEQRYTRRKTILIQLVACLQKTKMWDFIVNKEFFKVNEANKKMSKKVIADQYRSIMGLLK